LQLLSGIQRILEYRAHARDCGSQVAVAAFSKAPPDLAPCVANEFRSALAPVLHTASAKKRVYSSPFRGHQDQNINSNLTNPSVNRTPTDICPKSREFMQFFEIQLNVKRKPKILRILGH
jgi:hypothetical protein